MNSLNRKTIAVDLFNNKVKAYLKRNRDIRNENKKIIQTEKIKISHLAYLDCLSSLLSSNFIYKNDITVYNGALISNKIGTKSIDYSNQINSLCSALFEKAKKVPHEIITSHTYKKPKIQGNPPNKTETHNTLSTSNINLNKSLESFSYGKYVPKDSKDYEDLSLAEFLNEEIKNIKRTNTIRYNDISMSPKENNKTISMIEMNYRPSTPNPSMYVNKTRRKISQGSNFDTIEYYNRQLVSNKSKKQYSIISSNYPKKQNVNQTKISYNSFRNGITKKKTATTNRQNKKEPNSFIKLQKQKNYATIKVFDSKEIISQPLNKSSFNTINTPKKILNCKNSFISRPMTSSTSRNISFITSPKNQINANNKTIGGLFNIKIDLRELMKDDYDEAFSRNNNEKSFKSEAVTGARNSIDRLIIEQKFDENGNIVI